MIYCIVHPHQKPRRFYEQAAKEYEKRLGRFCKLKRFNNISNISNKESKIGNKDRGIGSKDNEISNKENKIANKDRESGSKGKEINKNDRIDDKDLLILITPEGTQLSSKEMATRLEIAETKGCYKRIIFFIISDFNDFDYINMYTSGHEAAKRATSKTVMKQPAGLFHTCEKWALTSVSLPSDLQTVLLLEQIYRAHKIIHNETYHK